MTLSSVQIATVALAFAVALSGAGQAGGQSAGVIVAIDANAAGNSARTVASIESCVTAAVGEPVDVDIAVLPPGIPADEGMSGFEFTLFFDSQVVSVTKEDPQMLAAQAPNSNLLYFGNFTLPNESGEHTSVAVDFGPRAIEPAGASETGAGVLSRITLLPEAMGISPLAIREVSLVDSEDRTYEPLVQQASIAVGEPCPAPSRAAAASPTPTPGLRVPPPPATGAERDPASPQEVTSAGGRPVGGGPAHAWLFLAGGGAIALGAAALVAAFRGRRWDGSSSGGSEDNVNSS